MSRRPKEGDAASFVNDDRIFAIPAGKTRHPDSPRGHWRQWEYALVAIQTLHGKRPPRNIDRSKLERDVNDWLNANSDYPSTGLKPIKRETLRRALEFLQGQSPTKS